MKTFLSAAAQYFRSNLRTIIIFIIFTLIFLTVFFFSNADIDAVIYSFILCAFAGIIFLSLGLRKFYLKHRTLENLRNEIILGTQNLPPADKLLEKDYQQLINILYEANLDSISSADTERKNMTEYYTMWVHQIKTPIAAMRLLLQSDQTHDSHEIEAQLFKIEEYVEMVLSYLRISSTATDFVIARCSLDEIIKQAVRKYAKLFIRKKISLEYSESGLTVLTDEKWLLFVIEQILSNSLKYTLKGKITISADENSVLTITDTGIGISAEDLPRVFENGYTGYNGRLDKKSTGIGLYLCSRIIKKLGHSIRIESQPEHGTCVIIDLDSTVIY
ncbi:MAG: sensor histidine kinase [Oscillospiraceae bacterium]|nr:sensor histidine kinase [Oscillospiraceae bacterium]